LRNAALAALVLSFLSSLPSIADAQRRVNTGGSQQAAGQRAWEIGFDAATIELGADDPQYLQLFVMSPTVRGAMFLSANSAIEGRLRWFSQARDRTPGFTSYDIDIGFLYGLTDLNPGTRAMYVRPGLMVSGASGGAKSRTTLSGAFGLRRPWHGVIMRHEIQLNRLLESSPQPAALYLDLQFGVDIRL
jgi:hypothetical protein